MITCPNCGRENPPEFKLCPMCGTPLAAPTGAGREERKVVSVLFCDLVGFTSRSEAMDVEDVRGTLQPYHELLRRTIESYGGTVEKFIGDAVMALFGAPVVHEDDPERAVRAALAIVEAVAGLREKSPALDLHVRLGVNTGEALIALDADPLRGEGMASGDVVNTAARLESAAPTDGLLVGEATYRATGRVIRYEAAPPVQAKGKTDPVPAWRALEARSRFGVDVDQGSRSAMVGRDRELDALRGAAERSFEFREVQLVTIVGVPGIGKSRLVWELQRWVDARPELIRWRQGRCLPYGEGVTYWALGEVLKAQAGILESDRAADTADKLDGMISAALPDPKEAGWVQRQVAGLVGLETGSTSSREEAFAAWRRLFEALAASGPMVVVFEDLHWADDAMLAFIDHLVEWASDVPLLVVCSARPELLERRRDWGGGKPNAATVALRPLSTDDTRKLVSALVEQLAVPAEVRDALLERSEGNPLYAEEYVRMLAEQGSAAAGVLPDTVQGIIAARLDGLPAVEKALLQDAAVLGKVVWTSGLAAIAGADGWELDEQLHRLTRKEFLRRAQRSSIQDDAEYAFRHVLVRDVAYAQIPRAQRAEKHERAAAWIESLTADRDDAVEMRAHHLCQALEYAAAAGQDTGGLRARTRQALRQAGERALRLDAHATAASHLRGALELTDADNPDLGYLLLDLGRALNVLGVLSEPELERAIQLLLPTDPAAAARAHAILGSALESRGDGAARRRHMQRALELVRAAPDSIHRARTLVMVAGAAVVDADPAAAVPLVDEYLRIAPGIGEPEIEIAFTRVFRGGARIYAGDADGILEASEAVDELREAGAFSLGNAINNLAYAHLILGHVGQSQALNREALEWLEERDPWRTVLPRADLAYCRYLGGEWSGALDAAAECERAQMPEQASVWMGVQARIETRRATTGAARLVDRALTASRDDGTPQAVGPELAESARLSLAAGQPGAAHVLVDQLLELGRSPAALVSSLPCLGAELAETAAVLELTIELREVLDGIGLDTPWREAHLASLAGEHARAAAVYANIGSSTDAAFAHLRAAETLAESDPAEAASHLERATGFYERVGATLYLDRARELKISRG